MFFGLLFHISGFTGLSVRFQSHCVCIGIHYVMVTKCPHQKISTFFGPHEETSF